MSIEIATANKLPYAVTKKQLFTMYLGQMSETQIRKGINTIIQDNRKECAPGSSAHVKLVWHAELIEFVETYGLPKGYSNPFEKK